MKYTGIWVQDSLTRISPWISTWPLLLPSPICLFWQGREPLGPAGSASPPQPSVTPHEPLHHTSLIIQERTRRQETGKLNSTPSIWFLVHRFQDIEEKNIEKYEVWGQPLIHSLTLHGLRITNRAECAMNMHEPGTHTCIFSAWLEKSTHHCHSCKRALGIWEAKHWRLYLHLLSNQVG